MFERFSQNKACFWKCLLQQPIEKIELYVLQIFMYYNNILEFMSDKTALCVGISVSHGLVVSVLQWHAFI